MYAEYPPCCLPLAIFIQGHLPLLLAVVAVRPAPAILYLFLACHVGENALNHSGLDSTLIDVLTLKVSGLAVIAPLERGWTTHSRAPAALFL